MKKLFLNSRYVLSYILVAMFFMLVSCSKSSGNNGAGATAETAEATVAGKCDLMHPVRESYDSNYYVDVYGNYYYNFNNNEFTKCDDSSCRYARSNQTLWNSSQNDSSSQANTTNSVEKFSCSSTGNNVIDCSRLDGMNTGYEVIGSEDMVSGHGQVNIVELDTGEQRYCIYGTAPGVGSNSCNNDSDSNFCTYLGGSIVINSDGTRDYQVPSYIPEEWAPTAAVVGIVGAIIYYFLKKKK